MDNCNPSQDIPVPSNKKYDQVGLLNIPPFTLISIEKLFPRASGVILYLRELQVGTSTPLALFAPVLVISLDSENR